MLTLASLSRYFTAMLTEVKIFPFCSIVEALQSTWRVCASSRPLHLTLDDALSRDEKRQKKYSVLLARDVIKHCFIVLK